MPRCGAGCFRRAALQACRRRLWGRHSCLRPAFPVEQAARLATPAVLPVDGFPLLLCHRLLSWGRHPDAGQSLLPAAEFRGTRCSCGAGNCCGAGLLACGRLSSRPWPLYPPPSAQPNRPAAPKWSKPPGFPHRPLRGARSLACHTRCSCGARSLACHAASLGGGWLLPRVAPLLGRKLSLWASLFLLWCRPLLWGRLSSLRPSFMGQAAFVGQATVVGQAF